MEININGRIQEECPDAAFMFSAAGQAKFDSVLESPAKKIIQMVKYTLLSYQFLCHCLKYKIKNSTNPQNTLQEIA